MTTENGYVLNVQQSPMSSTENAMALMTGGELEAIPPGERVELITDPVNIVLYNPPLDLDTTSLETQSEIIDNLKQRYDDDIGPFVDFVTCELL